MYIILDVDGSLCHYPNGMAKRVAERKIPWPIILVGLWIFKPKIDMEMIGILNIMKHRNIFGVFSRRPEQTTNYTEKFLEKNSIPFKYVKCLGSDDAKIKLALEEKADLVVDDNSDVHKKAREKGIAACCPETFKKLYYTRVIS